MFFSLSFLLFHSLKENMTSIAEGSSFSDLHGVLSDIYLLSISFDSVSFKFCRGESLCFEDSIAKKTLSDFIVNRTDSNRNGLD